MITKQQYTRSVSDAAYYLESNRRVAGIVLLRDTGAFLQLTGKNGAANRYFSQTVFQVTVAGSYPKLQKATGTPTVSVPGTETAFPARQGKNARFLKLGNLTIEAGYTPVFPCFLWQDENGKPYRGFTGNTTFSGDAGRSDRAGDADMYAMVDPHSNFHCNTKINKEGCNSLNIHYGKRINKPVRCGI